MCPITNFAKGRFSEVSNRGYRYQTVSVSCASLAFFNAYLQDIMQDVAFRFANRIFSAWLSRLSCSKGAVG